MCCKVGVCALTTKDPQDLVESGKVLRVKRGVVACLLLSSCSSEDAIPPAVAPPWDDDRDRLAHCTFEAAPARDARPAPAASPIKAGYGEALMRLPIGTPLGAYGDRVELLGNASPPDARATRWATGMTASAGMHDALRAEALALDTGGEPLVIVRVDAPFVVENVLFELERAVAPDGSMRGRIVLTASHSHSAWGAWLPTVHLSPGVDKPLRELVDRAVASLSEAVLAALENLAPARIGIAVEPNFDPDDRVSSDRRDINDAVIGPDGNTAGANKDPFVWALRVDDESGAPIVALVNLPVHGTVGEGANPLASTDVAGGIARALEDELGYPVMHLQGATGDIRPASAGGRDHCPDETRCLDMPRIELLGAHAAELLTPMIASIDTEDSAVLELVTRTFAIGRGGVVNRLDGRELYYLRPDPDYEPDRILFDAEGRAASPFDEFNTPYGAGLCGVEGGITFAPLGGVAGLSPYAQCIDLERGAEIILSAFEYPTPQLPFCDSVRATGAALRLGLSSADWLLVAIPGEPTAPFAAYLRSRSPAGPERTLLLGYSNDYAGYMLTAEDWLSGGYECSTNIWGPREGEQVLDGLLQAAHLAWTPEIEDPEVGSSRFDAFAFPPYEPIDTVSTSMHGTLVDPASALWWPDTTDVIASSQVPRAVGVARFAWQGGDPAIDWPEVVVEREFAPGRFEALPLATSRRGVVIVTYTPEPLESEAPTEHRYAASWQPTAIEPYRLSDPLRPYSLPIGRYRLVATGQALSGGRSQSYTAASTPFDVIAAPPATASQAVRGTTSIDVTALLGPAPGFRALRDGVSDGEVPLLGPWQVTVHFDNNQTTMVTVEPVDGSASIPLPANDIPRVVSVDVRDPAGNGGPIAVP